jgi:hypothetical protein
MYVITLWWTSTAMSGGERRTLRAAKRHARDLWREVGAKRVEIFDEKTARVWHATQAHGRGMLWTD